MLLFHIVLMRMVTFNVHGFRGRAKEAEVIRFAHAMNCDIMLQ